MRRLLVTLLAAPALVTGVIATTPAVSAASQGSHLATVAYTCTSGCEGTYTHQYTVTVNCDGTFSGTGAATDGSVADEAITGQFALDRRTGLIAITWTVVYPSGYTVQGTGTLDPRTGLLTGTATSDGQSFTVSGTLAAGRASFYACDSYGRN